MKYPVSQTQLVAVALIRADPMTYITGTEFFPDGSRAFAPLIKFENIDDAEEWLESYGIPAPVRTARRIFEMLGQLGVIISDFTLINDPHLEICLPQGTNEVLPTPGFRWYFNAMIDRGETMPSFSPYDPAPMRTLNAFPLRLSINEDRGTATLSTACLVADRAILGRYDPWGVRKTENGEFLPILDAQLLPPEIFYPDIVPGQHAPRIEQVLRSKLGMPDAIVKGFFGVSIPPGLGTITARLEMTVDTGYLPGGDWYRFLDSLFEFRDWIQKPGRNRENQGYTLTDS